MLSAARGWQSEELLELRTNCCSHTVCVAAQGDDLCMCALSRLVFALLLLTETLYLPFSFLAVCAQAALDGLWSERTDALQTRSHTLCQFAKRRKKTAGKKKAFLCILIECTLIICYSMLKSVARLCCFYLHINTKAQRKCLLCFFKKRWHTSAAVTESRKLFNVQIFTIAAQIQTSPPLPHWLWAKLVIQKSCVYGGGFM